MSLHRVARELESHGRGNDTQLVHMTPREVHGLQALANAHGGSLTTNPHTGLPEAGFLDSLLPMIAGAALTATGVGAPIGAAILGSGASAAAAGALGSGLLVGGATGLATGNLEKGLMAGLGAYGGAGLASGFGIGAGGVETALPTAPTAGAPTVPTNVPMFETVPGAANPAIPTTQLPNLQGADLLKQQAIGNAYPVAGQATPNLAGLDALKQNAFAANPAGMGPATEKVIGSQTLNVEAMPKPSTGIFSDFQAPESAKAYYDALPSFTLPATAASLAYGAQEKPKAPPKKEYSQRPYDFSIEQNPEAYANTDTTAEQNYFIEPRFTALPITTSYAAEGGLMGLALGGAVENMAAQNSISANSMYPQSQIQTSAYTNPMTQRPMPNNVISQGVDAPVDAYTGEPRFANGGTVRMADGGAAGEQSYWGNAYVPQAKFGTKSGFSGFGGNFYTIYDNSNYSVGDTAADQWVRTQIGALGYSAPKNSTSVNQGWSNTINDLYRQYYVGNRPTSQMTFNPQGVQGQQPQQNQQPYPQAPSPSQNLSNQFGSSFGNNSGASNPVNFADGGMASGGYNLGGYSDGGRLLKGPGDGVSDSIPAVIGNRQPARLADGEFVVPARIVSELGNGSTEAGARKLYAMMDRVQHARKKSIGKDKVAVNTNTDKLLPK